jgi:hypothetical protein
VFGPAIAATSAGLYEVLRLHRSTVSLKLGLGANVAAAIVVTMMLLAQLAFKGWLELKFPTASATSARSRSRRPTDCSSGSMLHGTCSSASAPCRSRSTCGPTRGSVGLRHYGRLDRRAAVDHDGVAVDVEPLE